MLWLRLAEVFKVTLIEEIGWLLHLNHPHQEIDGLQNRKVKLTHATPSKSSAQATCSADAFVLELPVASLMHPHILPMPMCCRSAQKVQIMRNRRASISDPKGSQPC